jgi:hypothetical protein
MQRLRGTDTLEVKALELSSPALAKSTFRMYDSAIKPYFEFCEEQGLPPLAATTATMAHYIAWIGKRGTIKAASLQPHLSTINGFFRDHCAESRRQCGKREAGPRNVLGLPSPQLITHVPPCPEFWPHRHASPRTYPRGSRTLGRKLILT